MLLPLPGARRLLYFHIYSRENRNLRTALAALLYKSSHFFNFCKGAKYSISILHRIITKYAHHIQAVNTFLLSGIHQCQGKTFVQQFQGITLRRFLPAVEGIIWIPQVINHPGTGHHIKFIPCRQQTTMGSFEFQHLHHRRIDAHQLNITNLFT